MRMLKPQLYSIFFMGFASGIPFLLILSTLSVWLAEVGISNTMIGVLAWVSIPYSLKFIWGALVDNFKIPVLHQTLGLRRSWILLAQLGVCAALIALGHTHPAQNLWATAGCALLVGIASAIQDITIEAYRIEILPQQIGVGTSASVLGYRFGMLCSGAGTIFLAAFFNNWATAYTLIAACMLIGVIATFCSAEPAKIRAPTQFIFWQAIKFFINKIDWQIIVLFVMSYKIADTVLNVMSMPFLVDIGFSKLEIATVAKTFGISAMIIGGIVGGVLQHHLELRFNLFMCVVLQAVASLLFMVQARLGHDLSFLFVSMGIENFTCGMSQVALIAYLSHLTGKQHTALHYAILSSFASLVRVCFSALAGWVADQYSWSHFYGLVCVSCVPSLLILLVCAAHFKTLDRHRNNDIMEHV